MVNTSTKRNYFVDLLVTLFGISTWIGITGTYLQLPQLVETAPESWTLPSFIVIVVQGGNIASLVYILYEKYSCVRFNDATIIYTTLVFACLASILMAFFHQRTIEVNGEPKSIPLFILTGMFAIVGCLSSVVFMPYMGRFREIYLMTFMFGQGLNGFISSIVSLIQGIGAPQCEKSANFTGTSTMTPSKPLFEPREYFFFVFGMLFLGLTSFFLLNTLRMCRKEYASGELHESSKINDCIGSPNGYDSIPNNTRAEYLSAFQYLSLMIVIGVISFLSFGILPGIQSFSCLPYGSTTYHFSTTLSSISNPLACLLTMYLSRSSLRSVTIQATVSIALAAYILLTALRSPTPPFVSSTFGKLIIISMWTLFQGIATFMKMEILTHFRLQGGRSLVWAGAVTQFGSCIGAVTVFILVNSTNLFVAYNPC